MVEGEFYNTGVVDMVCSLGYILENTATSETTILPEYTDIDLKVGYGAEQIKFTIPATTAEGTYKVYPAWKTADSTWKNESSTPPKVGMTSYTPNSPTMDL